MTAVSELPQRPSPALPGLRLPRRRERGWQGLLVSALIHAAIVIVALWPAKLLLDSGAGFGPGPRGGGGGGGRQVNYVALPAYQAPQAAQPEPARETVVVPPPIATPQILPVEDLARIEMPRDPVPASAAGSGQGTGGGPGSGSGTGGGQGTGSGTGTGADRGPGTGGDGSYLLQAQPRGLILPPECAKGGRFEVRFWVAVDGRVTNVQIDPLPREASCRRDFQVRMRGFRFEPAKTRDGTPVASVFKIDISR